MPTYAIGDIQGCMEALQKLLTILSFNNKRDVLWCTGDVVNRGPHSLEVLRFLKSLDGPHQVVLGNHDFHLIAVYYGIRETRQKDTLHPILEAPDADALIEWLCQCPLLAYHPTLHYVLVHAGLAPTWSLEKAQQIAREITTALQHPAKRIDMLKNIFGDTPNHWEDTLTGTTRLRVAVNYFTRMRFCYPDGSLNLTYKGSLKDKPHNLLPWFEVTPRANALLNIIFGHWAALEGKINYPNLFPLDTGCVWGGSLTAMRLEDGKRFSVPCTPCLSHNKSAT